MGYNAKQGDQLATATHIIITNEWTKQSLARAIPGAYFDHDADAWVLQDPTPRGAAVALKLFPALSREYPELEALRDELVQDVRPFDNATVLGVSIGADSVRAVLDAEDKNLYEFQSLDLGYIAAVLEQHGGAYIGWERGLGKTLATCCLIDELNCRRVLVVAPNTAKDSVWRAELERFLPDHVVRVLPNQKAKRERMLAEQAIRRSGRGVSTQWPVTKPLVLVVHYEALNIIAGKDGRGWKRYGEWDLVVCDEAHRIKNPRALMTRALKKVPARRKLALSGSIIQNHAEELFSPLQWLFPDRYKSKWRDWNDRFLDFVDGGYSRICVGVKLDRLEEMRQELGVFMVYRRKEDELDLPPKTEQTLLVDISPGQRRAYDELVADCVARLDDGTTVTAAEGLTLLTRLRQVATGLDLLGESVSDSTKLDTALDIINDSEDEAFVVFSWFKAACHALAERLEAQGEYPFVVTGDVPHEDRSDYIERFQNGEARVFIGTISTLGESVNLQRASNVITIDRPWNPAMLHQAIDRAYRIGQTRPVTVTHIVARDTVDEYNVEPALANKEALRRMVLGG
jgi:SNF2 family DNA or RNA helicase